MSMKSDSIKPNSENRKLHVRNQVHNNPFISTENFKTVALSGYLAYDLDKYKLKTKQV